MTKDEILVIRCNLMLYPDELKQERQKVMEQIKDGVVLLPGYMEPIIVPKNVGIKMVDYRGDISELKGETE